MNKTFTRIRLLLLMLIASSAMSMINAAPAGDPIITFHSSAYQKVGETNQFSMFLSTTETTTYTLVMGDYSQEYEIVPGSVNADTNTWDGTWISINVDEAGVVEIYGDAEKLNVLSIDGGYLTSIDFTPCKNIDVLSLQHNVLENLDLTPFHNLYAIYLSDNPFTGSESLTIGPDKPYLAILEMDIIQKIADGFNLSDYPSLKVFDGYYNFGLKTLDTSGCPDLLSLSIEMTAVDKLDLSNNNLLRSLNISESRVTDIDITMLPFLQIFIAGHDSGWVNQGYRLNSIDLTQNPELYYLSISGNHLGTLDLTQNPKLSHLMAGRNDLRELDLTNNPDLYSVSLVFNDLDFATLPMPQISWGEYWYRQNALSVPRSIAKGAEVDLSARVLRDGTTTTASLWAVPLGADEYELDESYYTYADGKFTINTIPEDSVYVKFSNNVFYEYPLVTSNFKVKEASEMGAPSLIVNMNVDPSQPNLRFAVGMAGATPETPKKFLVELATDVFTEFETTFADEPTGYNVDIPMPADFNGNVGIYIPEDDVMTSFSVVDHPLTAINVTKATELSYLTLNGCGLYGINLAYNRCLRYLDVSNNHLTELDLQGIYGNYAKNVLTTVKASHNEISQYSNFKFNDTSTFHYLDLSYNKFEFFKLLDFENLEYVDLSHNCLNEEIYLTYQISASHIDLSYNNLPSVVIDHFDNIECLDLSNNVFTYTTLPLPAQVGSEGYIYAPQQVYELPQKAPAIDLTAQNLVIDGVGTTFDWKKADGTPLEQGVDVDCVDGATRFLKADLGKVYCVMTNPAFPLLSGENEYRTSEVTPMTYPTQVVATFTTTKDSDTGDVTFTGSRKTELYIDWRGDGKELISYPVKTSYINYPGQQTYAGAEVKVYTYDRADLITVFSVTGIPMSEADLSALTKATCINLSGSGLTEDNVKLPETAPVREFSMSACGLTSFPWAEQYASTLAYLNLSDNRITSFDASVLPKLQTLSLNKNGLTEIHFDNPSLWGVALLDNELTSIDLSGLPGLDQIDLSDNRLSSIDLSPVASTIKVLMVPNNCFNFATLPVMSDYPMLSYYTYGYQAEYEITSADGKVDMSALAYTANGVPSVFTWYLGPVEWDYDNSMWVGTVMTEGEDYTVEDGVTTFLHPLDDDVMCLIDNEEFPYLTMYTNLVEVVVSGINDIVADSADGVVNVYTPTGVLVRRNVSAADAVRGLAPGCYIVGTKKIFVK